MRFDTENDFQNGLPTRALATNSLLSLSLSTSVGLTAIDTENVHQKGSHARILAKISVASFYLLSDTGFDAALNLHRSTVRVIYGIQRRANGR